MLILALQLALCVVLAIGLIVTLLFCNKRAPAKASEAEKPTRIDFAPTSVNEELLVQNALMAYYEQQRRELIERQKAAVHDTTTDTTVPKANDSGYASVLSPSETPHSVYECSGFATMDNVEVSNPLFSTDVLCDSESKPMPSVAMNK